MLLMLFFYLWVALLIFAIMYAVYNTRVIVTPRLFVVQTRRDGMADMLTYSVSAAPVVDHDVVERQLVVVVDGAVATDKFAVFAADATSLGEISVPQGSSVTLTLVDVDDAGNRSEPAVVEFVAEDTLAPAQPGSFGVTLVGEAAGEPEAAPADAEVTEDNA